jgi:hypothetical protein
VAALGAALLHGGRKHTAVGVAAGVDCVDASRRIVGGGAPAARGTASVGVDVSAGTGTKDERPCPRSA